jgi:hypothetical protein
MENINTRTKVNDHSTNLDADEVRIAFVGNRLGEQRLTRSRRTVEQNTL